MTQPSKRIRRKYGELRRSIYNAAESLSIAKTWADFEDLEREGLVRLRAEEECDSYFDVYGEPDAYTDRNGRRVTAEQARQETVEQIERVGCWYVVAEWRASEEGAWEHADSVGMSVYHNPLDPRENSYVPDLMRSAIDAVRAEQDAAADYAMSC